MNCKIHLDQPAVNFCSSCGSGLCDSCTDNAIWKIENRPLCLHCSQEPFFNHIKALRKERIMSIVRSIMYSVFLILGLFNFFYDLIYNNTGSWTDRIAGTLFIWGLSFIIRYLTKSKDSGIKVTKTDILFTIAFPEIGGASILITYIFRFLIGLLKYFMTAITLPYELISNILHIKWFKQWADEAESIYSQTYTRDCA